MEESKKKPIMIGVIIACFAVAVGITIMTRPGAGGGGIPAEYATQQIWMKCRNDQCNSEWEMNKLEYYKFLEQFRVENPGLMGETPAVTCTKCSEPSCYVAAKCAKCGFIFEKGTVPKTFEDRCPKCGYSSIEEDRKKKAEERARGG
jgi:DNA-directed RNA polymerase subunit RPC12/RpoP